jgi:hypothetical protein
MTVWKLEVIGSYAEASWDEGYFRTKRDAVDYVAALQGTDNCSFGGQRVDLVRIGPDNIGNGCTKLTRHPIRSWGGILHWAPSGNACRLELVEEVRE